MTAPPEATPPELGFDVPATIGMAEAEIQTPCLILDLDALERNITKMGAYAKAHGMRHRVHGKMHKSVDVARLQQRLGSADGVCCQKVSEAEVFARGGITDILISNQVRDPVKLARLAALPRLGARISVCIDDIDNVAELSAAAQAAGTTLDVLVEIDCGGRRCGVATPAAVVRLARAVEAAPALSFGGVQAYQGSVQHLARHQDRKAKLDIAIAQARAAVEALSAAGLPCPIVTGGGTGTFEFESGSGVYNELQCGSYAFMDAAYGRVLDTAGNRLDTVWQNALFVLTSIMSRAVPGRAVCDAGLKSMSAESGLPVVHGRPGLSFDGLSDEHGVIDDPAGALAINDRVRLIPGHCDPTVNLHDCLVGVRAGRVETIWPVSARGKSF